MRGRHGHMISTYLHFDTHIYISTHLLQTPPDQLPDTASVFPEVNFVLIALTRKFHVMYIAQKLVVIHFEKLFSLLLLAFLCCMIT